MEYRKLKNTDLTVSRLCVGGCPMGGYGWGQVSRRELEEAVHAALDAGINFFDTADVYGLGQAELTLATALGSRRKDVVIAGKFGVRRENGTTIYDNSPGWIRAACESSLRRLGTDVIDLYQLHYRDGVTPMEAVVDTLEALRQEGKIRYFGLSNCGVDDLPELGAFVGRFASLQLEYSLARRENEGALQQLAEELRLTPMTWGSLGQGILTGKYTENSVFGPDDRRSRDQYVNFHGEKLCRNIALVERMRPIAAVHGKPLSALALRFILDKLPDSVAICGMKRPQQLRDNVQALDWHLEAEELAYLDAVSGKKEV